MPPKDPRVARFIERFSCDEREAVRRDVEKEGGPWTLAEKWERVRACCRAVVWATALKSPEDRARELDLDRPHPSYYAIMERLKKKYREQRASE